MKTTKKQKLTILLPIILLCQSAIMGEQVSKWYYSAFPEKLNNMNVILPSQYRPVAMSESIRVGTPVITSQTEVRKASIFFIIDHSGSMMGSKQTSSANDRWGNRFKVTLNLLDTLKARFDTVEVGVAVFRKYLYFYTPDNSLFKETPQWPDSGAYIPLFDLNKHYGTANKTGYTILKELIAVQDSSLDSINADPDYYFTDLKNRPSDMDFYKSLRSWTNINAGFDAAKDAFSFSSFPKKQQFIIFLSDGEATYPGNGSTANTQGLTFQQGVNVPTTFTIYFTKSGNAPASLATMTNNIIANGYSESNSKSNLWAYNNTTADSLMSFIVKNVVSQISKISVAKPISISVNGKNPVVLWNGKFFTFGDLFELTGPSTHFVFDMHYQVKDSVNQNIPSHDTTYSIAFNVNIADQAQSTDSVVYQRWDRSIGFFNNNIKIDTASEAINTLQVRFTEQKVECFYGYDNVALTLITKSGATRDTEEITLAKAAVHEFSRDLGIRYANNQTKIKNDGIIMCDGVDQIEAIFRNDKLRLDTLRQSIPFRLSRSIAFSEGSYFDNNGDGFIDSIAAGLPVAGLTDAHIAPLLKMIVLPQFRYLNVKSGKLLSNGLGLSVTQNTAQATINTATTDNDCFAVSGGAIQDIGGYVVQSNPKIKDKMGPVIIRASLLDYVSSNHGDTLTVEFSEPVREILRVKPFCLRSDSIGKVYMPEMKFLKFSSETKALFEVTRLVDASGNSYDRVRDKDSIWINPDFCVQDMADNYQLVNQNRHVRLFIERIYPIFDIVPHVLTPVDISNLDKIAIPIQNIKITDENKQELQVDKKINNSNYSGIVIQISAINFEEQGTNFILAGTFTIVDALGNMVVRSKQLCYDEKTKKLSYIWNGKNLNGRTIDAGTYVVASRVTAYSVLSSSSNQIDKALFSKQMRVMIGIKK